jgi:hypothetical protein
VFAFSIGFMPAMLLGLLTGWVLFTPVGALMKRDDYTRHHYYEPAPSLAPAPVQVVAAERVMPTPPPPPVVNVWVAAPQLPPHHYPRPIDLDTIQRELPASTGRRR